MEQVDIGLLLEDLKDFYVWKEFKNNKDFISKWIDDREGVIKSVPRSMMSK